MRNGLAGLLEERARISPGHEAIVDVATGARLTFAVVEANTKRLASALAPMVAKGDRLAVLMGNGPRYAEILFAALRIGAIVVPLNLRLTAAEIEYQLEDCRPALAVFDTANAALAERLSAKCKWMAIDGLIDGAAGQSDETIERVVSSDDGALILYTSGTTGRPKGALHTHGSSLAWCALSLASFENRFGDRQLLVAPLFHIAGICLLFNAVHRGFTLVVTAAFDPGQAWELIESEQITSMFAVPTMINMMREHEGRQTRSHRTLRWIMCGAAPVPVSLIDAYAELGIDIHQVYGSTETHGGIAVLPPAFAHSRKGSTGLAMFGGEIRAVDSNGDDVVPGERGELISRGAHIFREYWGKPDATRDAFIGDWFRLGDIGVIDQDGFITVLDRAKDMIISGGENIYPAEVEDVLMRHPGLLEVAVIGEADERWGERVVAFVVKRPGSDGEGLVQGLTELAAERLGAFKRPKRYEAIATLPRNASGKVLKHVLRDRLASK